MAERGFTLIEALAAFAALAITLGPALGAMGAGARGGAAAAERLEALARAETALARAGVAAPLTAGARETRDGPWRLRVEATPYAAAGGLALWRVSAEVAWGAGARARRVALETLKPGPGPG